MIKLLIILTLISYCLFIYWLSAQPSLPAPMWFEHQDKVHHAGAYFIMALLVWRTLAYWLSSPLLLAPLSVLFCSIYGISDEWHQSFVEHRSSDTMDWLADTIGASIAASGLLLFYKISNKAHKI
ncbi:MAG: VanZ family protein [Methylovulum sp.]|nr:VanZ family protein [Methylovulum sp.]